MAEARGQLGHEQGFANAWISIEHTKLADRDVRPPEPRNTLGLNRVHGGHDWSWTCLCVRRIGTLDRPQRIDGFLQVPGIAVIPFIDGLDFSPLPGDDAEVHEGLEGGPLQPFRIRRVAQNPVELVFEIEVLPGQMLLGAGQAVEASWKRCRRHYWTSPW